MQEQDPPPVRYLHEQILAARADIGAIGKDDRNPQQGWQFRSFAAVIDRVSAATHEHGINIRPELLDLRYDTIAVGNPPRSAGHAIVTVKYVFDGNGPGAVQTAIVPGEAMDFGDKAVSKAMTVAYRTALSQFFQIPFTDSSDPDHDVYERTERVGAAAVAAGPSWTRRIDEAGSMEALRGLWQDAVADELTHAVLPDGRTVARAIGERKKTLAAHEEMLAAIAADGGPAPDVAALCEPSAARDQVMDRLAAMGDIDAIVAECYGLPVAQVSTARLRMLADNPGELLPSTVWTGP